MKLNLEAACKEQKGRSILEADRVLSLPTLACGQVISLPPASLSLAKVQEKTLG